MQARGVAFAAWKISNLYTGDFAGFAATPGVVPLTGDFNGDGRTDVALVNRKAGWTKMPVAFANGDGTWRVISGSIDSFASWATTSGVQVLTGDFNGDKRTDVALLNQAAGWTTMPVAFARSDDTWQVINSVSNIGAFAGFAATPGVVPLTGDFNGDGRTDVALVNGAPGWGSMPVAFWHDRRYRLIRNRPGCAPPDSVCRKWRARASLRRLSDDSTRTSPL